LTLPSDLPELVETLADWADKFTVLEKVYLFGSRVSGNHHDKSDVDVYLETADKTNNLARLNSLTEQDMALWDQEHANYFAALNSILPGTLHAPENLSPNFIRYLKNAEPTMVRGKVICVFTLPKPPS
jgi:predicted nucleotidyltransferase